MEQAGTGSYRIERPLATGGMAEVYVATRIGPHGFEKRVALKRILPQYVAEPEFVQMFIDEARLAAQLEHPNIVQVFDFGQDHDSLFIAMELVDGTNVHQLLRAVASRDEQVPLEVALNVALASASALAHAHSLADRRGECLGVVHRDVSPANLLLTRTGQVKLTDFGIARAATYERRTQTGELRGKLGYMSPEQVSALPLDGRSDVFTLATVLAEMLIAEPLFGKGEDLEVLVAIRDADLAGLHQSPRRIPQDIRELLMRALAREREERPDALGFYNMLRQLMQRRGIAEGTVPVARLLSRLQLIEWKPGDSAAIEPGARPTNLVDVDPPSQEITARQANPNECSYRVKVEGRCVGPLSFASLTEMWLRGQMEGSTEVESDGVFRPAREYAELARYVGSPALQWGQGELLRPTWQGRLEHGRLLPVVHRLMRARETGVLHLHEGARRKKIYFDSGRCDFISSTDPQELLGAFLVRTNRCLQMEVDMALAMLPTCGGRLSDALISLGALRPVELVKAIREQARWRMLEAFRWDTGAWCYVRGPRSEEETFDVQDDPYELLPSAAQQVPPAVVANTMEGLGPRLLRRTPSLAPMLAAYQMSDGWRRLLQCPRGGGGAAPVATVVGELVDLTGEPLDEVQRALYFGVSCELLRVA